MEGTLHDVGRTGDRDRWLLVEEDLAKTWTVTSVKAEKAEDTHDVLGYTQTF
jgi:hypothetical protein